MGLPILDKPFTLCIHETLGVGVLIQKLGPNQRLVGYFSEQLDSAAQDGKAAYKWLQTLPS